MATKALGGVVGRRLANVLLDGPRLPGPQEVVRHLLAVQSQDYLPALWSLGQRSAGPEPAVHAQFQAGLVLRTHVLRPTWHFVLPEDLRWLLALTAPRVHQLNAYYYRQQRLDGPAFARARAVLAAALADGQQRTRAQLVSALGAADLPTAGLGVAYVLMHAELEGLVCSGAMVGRQHTYALLADRVPAARPRTHEEALTELVVRYFASHGPATAKDLHWWSSLTLREIAAGIEAAGARLETAVVDGLTLVSAAPTTSAPARSVPAPRVHLVQGYDEYVVGYSESKRLLDPIGAARELARETNRFNNVVLLDGEAVGAWKRTLRRDSVRIEVDLYRAADDAALVALRSAADGYARFVDRTAELTTATLPARRTSRGPGA